MLPARYSSLQVVPPKRFDFRAARSRAIALMMATQRAKPDDNSSQHRLLATAGRRAAPKLLTLREFHYSSGASHNDPSEGFENRFIADPQHTNATRQRIREAKPQDAQFLLSHGIDDQAAARLRDCDFEAFLGARRAFFITKEKQFVESLGLTYVEDEQ